MAKKIDVQKEPVKLREKVLKNGSISLFLDIYSNGRRHKEYLKLYLIKATTQAEKEQNRETLATAQAIKAKRQIEIQNGQYDFTRQFKEDILFLPYFRDMIEERGKNADSKGNYGNWKSCLRYLEIYCDEKTTFRDVTPEFVQGFKDYLDVADKEDFKRGPNAPKRVYEKLSTNTKVSYFNKLRACINHAFNERIIPTNPIIGITGFKAEEVKRDYLTFEEVKQLANTPCASPLLKRAFLFSCLTGLRASDIEKLTWDEVKKFGEYTRIEFKQKKTGGQEYMDIPAQAVKYLGERGEPTERVFSGFKYGVWISTYLRKWCDAAGITKKELTFHCGRHTFAVLMLDLGTDLFTVSKLLGHKDIKTTQIYAKVLDKNKQKAVSLIPNLDD